MSPKVKEEAKAFIGGLHQWMTLLGFPIIIYLVSDIYKDFKTDHEDKIRRDEIQMQHTEQIKNINHNLNWQKGQMNYVLNRLAIDPIQVDPNQDVQ